MCLKGLKPGLVTKGNIKNRETICNVYVYVCELTKGVKLQKKFACDGKKVFPA